MNKKQQKTKKKKKEEESVGKWVVRHWFPLIVLAGLLLAVLMQSLYITAKQFESRTSGEPYDMTKDPNLAPIP